MRSTSPTLSRARRVPDVRKAWAGLRSSAESLVGGLDEGPELVAMTSGAWSVMKVLGLLRERVGRPGAVDVWTWTLSRRAIERLKAWQREGVAVRVCVDSSLWRRQPAYGAALVSGPMAASVRAFSSHVKAARVVGPRGSVFIAGSGNLNLCRRAELVWLSSDPALSRWLEGLTDAAFAAIPEGAPIRGQDADLDARLAQAFPARHAAPIWAQGLPVLTKG